MRITVVSAGLGVPSSSRMLADQLSTAVREELTALGETVVVENVEARDYAVDIANNLVTGYAPPALASMLQGITESDALVVVTPVFSGSYSGLLKSLFDVMDNTALQGMPVILGATGGSARHSLMLEHAMRPLFSYLRARVVPTAVYASPQDWGAGHDDEQPLDKRVRRAARELAEMVGATSAPRVHEEPLESLPFEDLLANITRSNR
ncbi:NADPH-dependent FMN reductase [Arthrobacter sp. NamB2]|uniref:FMN reductase n=1 Tax=Arthrobacter sp. NamB2 TaxID=2576035 RepID=UPI0010C97568|nr:FMN reductase [Arthrobacter sp. NamB2]TKV28529.1 NADPH-dependent FMN reductase [Arthrobacter sp. NamB2]